jgi:hypothetical protein
MADAAAAAVADLPVVPVKEPWMFDWDKRFTKPDLVRLAEFLGAPGMGRFSDEEILKKTLHAELAAIVTNCLRLLHESKTQGEQDSNTADDERNQAVLPDVMAEPEEHDDDASLTTVRSVDTDEQALKSMEMLLQKAGYETRDLKEVLQLNEQFVVFLTKMTELLNDPRDPPAKTPEAERFIVDLKIGRTQIKEWERRAKKKFHQAKKGSNENAFMDQIHATQIKNLMKYLGPRVDEIFYRLLEQNEMTEHQVDKMTAPPQKSSRGSRSSASSTSELM